VTPGVIEKCVDREFTTVEALAAAMLAAGIQESGVRGQESGDRSQESGVGGQFFADS
jgi:hypothetical protein